MPVISWTNLSVTSQQIPNCTYIDANALVTAFTQGSASHAPASSFVFAVLLDRSKQLAVSPLVLAECYCTIFRLRYRQQKNCNATAPLVKADRAFQRSCHTELDKFFAFIEKFVQLGRILVVDNQASARGTALTAIKDIPLLPYDALHYASLRSAGIKGIATRDADFDAIADPDLTVLSL